MPDKINICGTQIEPRIDLKIYALNEASCYSVI